MIRMIIQVVLILLTLPCLKAMGFLLQPSSLDSTDLGGTSLRMQAFKIHPFGTSTSAHRSPCKTGGCLQFAIAANAAQPRLKWFI